MIHLICREGKTTYKGKSEGTHSFYEKDYFKTTEDEMVVIHSAYILEPDLVKRRQKSGSEKDFLIVNKTRQYILNVEVKTSFVHQKTSATKTKTESAFDQIAGLKIGLVQILVPAGDSLGTYSPPTYVHHATHSYSMGWMRSYQRWQQYTTK